MSTRLRTPAARRVSPLMVVWLTAVWVALWGNLSFANVLTGAVIAVAILALLPLPPGRAGLAFRPWGLIRFVVLFVVDLVVSSLRVAWQALWPGRLPRSSVVGVALIGRSDVMLTATVLALNVMPGSIVIEIRQGTPTVIYIHALGAETPAAVEAARRSVVRLEARVIAAFGTREEFALLNRTRGGRP
ncbi:Na+/H+ antiporter subunit E [Streptomyces sp. SID3343]|uniref:Na+/H+ antiporter subunit E n=1 Tax=Streptomyces sp. SID3343 TaxID=2690260 RepID=UPI00136A65E9|nr:Na+/H+ antiporter subunit E [Streptomyces sp. SID3343]MYV97423.1 Na+/H+ antiporter subunit E [Streptomyces sp. SID3343]